MPNNDDDDDESADYLAPIIGQSIIGARLVCGHVVTCVQYRNASNPLAHFDCTAEEILDACDGSSLTFIVVGSQHHELFIYVKDCRQ